MKDTPSGTKVKQVYVSRNLYERAVTRRNVLAKRCSRQEARIAHLNAQVIALKELAAATAALQFHREQEPAAVRRYNMARRAVA